MKETLLKLEKYIADFPQTVKKIIADLIEDYRVLRSKFKDLATTNYNLGIFHIDRCNMSDAKMRFIFTIKLNPNFALAHYHLARCHLFNLEFDKARSELEIALSLDKNLEAAKYRLDLLNQSIKDEPIPLQVIEEDYDNLADQYENFIENQQKYEAPELLAKMIAKHVEEDNEEDDEDDDEKEKRQNRLKALDIGCGTGLVGFYLRQAVAIKSLFGIDISKRMLNLAEELEVDGEVIYDHLEEGDFNNLKHIKGKYSIITACMSLVYNNNLSKFFVELEKIIDKQAILGLVLLKSNNEDIIFNYKHGCFSFSLKYLKNVLKKHKWNIVEQKEIKLFVDGDKGLLFVLKK